MHPYGAQHDRAASAPANEFHDRVHNVVQIGHVREFRLAASDAAETRQWPIRIGAIPDLAAARQSRALDERLASSPFHTGATCLILHGMGGAGKTQAAAAYAHDRWRSGDIELLVWVNAASRDAVIATYAQDAAVTTLKGLLADRSRVLGPDHPKAAATRADLEFWAARAAMH